MLAMLVVLGGGGWLLWSRPTPGPIVIISIDTLRADRLPAYGYAQTKTPTIDALANDGVLFEHAYSHAPQTLPAHVSILSGRLPFEHGVRDNIGFTVSDSEVLLPQVLREQGYATAAFVSSYVLRRQVGLNRGFDVYDDALPKSSPNQSLAMVQRPGRQTVDAATAWIARQESERYFLFVHLYEPHTPYTPPPEFAAADPYDGEVAYADALTGDLMASLKAAGQYEAATIILLSDHGEGLGTHGEEEHGLFLYRDTIQVPLIIKLPGEASAGRRVREPVQQIDLMPTLRDLIDLPPDSTLRGRTLRPVLDGTGTLPTASIYAETLMPRLHFGWSELYAITDDRYRFIRAPRSELYDLEEDPGEANSIVDERASVRDAMRQALDTLIAGASVSTPSTVSDADRERLAALGYVGTSRAISASTPGDTLPDPKDKLGVLQQYRRASVLAGQRQWAAAADAFRAVLKDDPDIGDVWLQLARAEEAQGRLPAALEAYQELIRRQPDDPAGLTGAAAILVQMGRFDEARAHAELATTTAPAIAHELLARLALQRGDIEAARRHAADGEAADPSAPLTAFINGLILYNQNRFADAVTPLRQASQRLQARTEQIADVNYLLGDTLARLERFGEAEAAFKAELATFPTHVRARAGLAMVYWSTERRTDALATAEQLDSLARQERVPGARELAQQLWTIFGQPERAAALNGGFR